MPKKKKLGRPNHGLAEVLIALRMPASLRSAARDCARLAGMNVSEWWRHAAQAQIEAAGRITKTAKRRS